VHVGKEHSFNTHINQIHDNIKLNPTHEIHNSINFLNLTITCKKKTLKQTYRKPTTTDATINFHSNHPIEHKMAVFRFHISRMYSLPLHPEKKQREGEIIEAIAKNNNFPQNLLQKLNRQIQRKINRKKGVPSRPAYRTVTYTE
jgi:hypothetical protein